MDEAEGGRGKPLALSPGGLAGGFAGPVGEAANSGPVSALRQVEDMAQHSAG